eukprot:TRINITY_DN22_c0_g1_i3.p1 TRINITY_DN22_c0_g1~~TRINITY_DN22_c0_g1_i3.p1  ORF type:complete len:383 (-),score=54.50 TRINITY_DN22_c0_g1_i3:45-1193(-)
MKLLTLLAVAVALLFFASPSLANDVCTEEAKECPDGTFVARNPKNNCKFDECTMLVCTADVKLCADGFSYVSRDPSNGCQFQECPCEPDEKKCEDGSSVSRDPDHDCTFKPCPFTVTCDNVDRKCPEHIPSVKCFSDPCSLAKCGGGQTCKANYCGGCNAVCCDQLACTDDVKECEDGSFVSRDPDNNCKFKPCPLVVIDCQPDKKECKDGSFVTRDPDRECKFKPCPFTATCDNVDRKCPDRAPAVECFSDPCSTAKCGDGQTCKSNYCGGCNAVCCNPIVCAADVKECKDGSSVSRDPEKGCKFAACPFHLTCRNVDKECPKRTGPQVLCAEDPCSLALCPEGRECHSNYCGGWQALSCVKKEKKTQKTPPLAQKGEGAV